MKKNLPLLFLLLPFLSTACICFGPDNFCETVSEKLRSPSSEVPLVVRAQKMNTVPEGMEIRVKEVLSGNAPGSSLIVRGGNGATCYISTDGFQDGMEFVALLERFDSDDYIISICGVHILPIENEIIKGPAAKGVSSLPYKDLFFKPDCSELRGSSLNSLFRVFPTLTQNSVQIYYRAREEEIQLNYTVYDAVGRKVVEAVPFIMSPSSRQSIELGHLADGVYLIELAADTRRQVYEIVLH
ncbi:MAG: T9SS type A sorting domain-containing protein [Bacteroidota bacterium]